MKYLDVYNELRAAHSIIKTLMYADDLPEDAVLDKHIQDVSDILYGIEGYVISKNDQEK